MKKMMTVNENDACLTCDNTYGWHLKYKPIHPFNNGQAGATDFLKRRDRRDVNRPQRESEGPPIASMPVDHVLRIALIGRGILTPAHLAAAEQKLRNALAEVEASNGEGEVQVRTTAPVPVGGVPEGSEKVGTRPGYQQERLEWPEGQNHQTEVVND